MDESPENYTQWKESLIPKGNEHILYDSIYVTILKQQTFRNGERLVVTRNRLGQQGGACNNKRVIQGILTVMELFNILTVVLNIPTYIR